MVPNTKTVTKQENTKTAVVLLWLHNLHPTSPVSYLAPNCLSLLYAFL